jgi:UV DNA damage endonuclease
VTAPGLRLGSHRIVLHVGSGAAGPEQACERFAAGFAQLPRAAAQRLALENDERWPLDAVLELAGRLDVPVVFDAFHHSLAPSFPGAGVRELVGRTAETWRNGGGRQEVHFSTQEPGKRPGAHAEAIDLHALARFVAEVGDLPLDCVLEVKDKERSVLRAREIRASTPDAHAASGEREAVLEDDPARVDPPRRVAISDRAPVR